MLCAKFGGVIVFYLARVLTIRLSGNLDFFLKLLKFVNVKI